jgi:hypothetical protein
MVVSASLVHASSDGGLSVVVASPSKILRPVSIGLGISDKKNIPRKTELTEILDYSGGIPTVARNRKLSEFRSEPLRRGEKCLEFSTV